ncbi:MAG: YggS family pyridoxal phosphate-dependent enzyme [Enterococcus sp.]
MISDNLREVRQEIQKSCALVGRQSTEVTLVAVTKNVDADTTAELIAQGVEHCAENRVDKFLAKKAALANDDIVWHFIGNLQRRKVKAVINEIDYFHALDSLKLAQEIAKRATKVIKCFVEVNVANEPTKNGIAPTVVHPLMAELSLLENIQVVGLMMMAPYDSTQAEQKQYFEQLYHLQQSVIAKEYAHCPCTQLSMGMSNDYQVAIQSGATFVRIGTRLFQE